MYPFSSLMLTLQLECSRRKAERHFQFKPALSLVVFVSVLVFGVRSWLKFNSLKMMKGAFFTAFYSASGKGNGRKLKITVCAFHLNICLSAQIYVIMLNAIWPLFTSTPPLPNDLFFKLANLRHLLKLPPPAPHCPEACEDDTHS